MLGFDFEAIAFEVDDPELDPQARLARRAPTIHYRRPSPVRRSHRPAELQRQRGPRGAWPDR